MEETLALYKEKKEDIKSRLNDFKSLPISSYIYEFLFCLLTPQSNAKKCWQAIEELKKLSLSNIEKEKLISILKSKTRFHNNKSSYIIHNLQLWPNIQSQINSKQDTKELRNWLSENVLGFGLKEASHFLRNIGKSNNKIAILDRHILRNLKQLSLIEEEKIKNSKHYLEVENIFLDFASSINIPADHLDLLWWSKENGDIFK